MARPRWRVERRSKSKSELSLRSKRWKKRRRRWWRRTHILVLNEGAVVKEDVVAVGLKKCEEGEGRHR